MPIMTRILRETAPCNYASHVAALPRFDASIFCPAAPDGPPSSSSGPQAASQPSQAARAFDPEVYVKPFCDFISGNPTVFHASEYFALDLERNGFQRLPERADWELERGGKYYVDRNKSSIVAFVVGQKYEPGNGAAMIAGHIDALTAKVKPISALPNKAGYLQLGVAPYAGSFSGPTWWDRDLGIAGRVLVRQEDGKVVERLVKLDWPIARIPTLAPHFGAIANGPFNPETHMVPIIGLDNSALPKKESVQFQPSPISAGERTFASTQPPGLVKAIATKLELDDHSSIVNWELELFDTQPAQLGGLNQEFIFAGRLDDKLSSWSAIQALKNSAQKGTRQSSLIKLVALFDDEEIGSLLRQGARSNLLPSVVERIIDSFKTQAWPATNTLLAQTYAKSFLASSDNVHAVNPNFPNAYLENHSPQLNVGVAISADPNGHMTTDCNSTAILEGCARRCGSKLQLFQIRNDVRSGSTVGPSLSSALGVRAADVGVPQLSMHSIRATTGRLDPGLGVQFFQGYLDYFEDVDRDFLQQ